MKRINTRFSELLERKKSFNVQFTRSFASREKDTSKSSGSENSDDDLNGVLDEEKLINEYGIAPNVSVEELKQLCDRFKKLNNTIKNAKDKEAIKSSTEERSNQMNKLAGKMMKYLDISLKNLTMESLIIGKCMGYEKKLHENFGQIKGALDILELTTEAYSIGIRAEMRAVGLDKDIERVVSKLKSGNGFHVVWIVGMMGIGKTTLAKNIYLHHDIVRHFPGRDWVTLTDEKAKQEENGGGDWRNKVRDIWKKEKKLLVLDDFTGTEENKKDWETLKAEFPEGDWNGSRILLTTRDLCVARTVGQPSQLHCLRLRTKEESWRLFVQMVDDFESAADNVKKLAEETVGRCVGLPLQILHYGYLILMSGIDVKDPKFLQWLQHFKIPAQKPWLDYLKNEVPTELKKSLHRQEKENKDFPQHEDKIFGTILKTMEDCPPSERDCPPSECDLIKIFSFFNLFPKDHEIPARRLVTLFDAERLVKCDKNKTHKVLVQHYLKALSGLTLIQAVEMNIDDEVKKCRLPSALREHFFFESVSDKHFVSVSDKHLAHHCHVTGINSSDLKTMNKELISCLSFDPREGYKPGEDVRKFLQEASIAQHHRTIKSAEVSWLKVDLPGGNPIIHRQPTEPPNSGCEAYLCQNSTQIHMEVAETSTPILEPESSK
ncbi:disease resistance protein RPP13-like [Castanea sativa]|uniref:disease resistance protein RPP13-like n=1 Tax=Castanea sativa TaxID=21020 RepID=UPI003F64BAFE